VNLSFPLSAGMILCLPDRSPRVTDGRTHPVTADSSRLVMRNRSCVPTSRLPAVRRNTIWFTIARYVCFGCRLAHLSRRRSIQRFTLYGSPHSLPTYKVALLLRMSEEPFAFRYVSFQKKMHQTPEFVALSRWGQVPVLVEGKRVQVQSAAIVEYLSDALDRFQGPDPIARQAVREWLYWDVDALFPAIFGCYAAELDRKKLLPLNIDPAIAAFRHKGAESAMLSLDGHLQPGGFLCSAILLTFFAWVTSLSPRNAASIWDDGRMLLRGQPVSRLCLASPDRSTSCQYMTHSFSSHICRQGPSKYEWASAED
jgi:glutathione S-transferase